MVVFEKNKRLFGFSSCRMRFWGVSVWTILAAEMLLAAAYNPPERLMGVRPTFEGQTARPLRYVPEGRDFVIENGAEFFNRPLYGGNTAFRADAGDRPEVSLYLPGQAGVLRFGLRTAGGAIWLHEADRILSRYRPGSMRYEIRDDLFGKIVLHLSVLALYEAEGVIVRVDGKDLGKETELIVAFGGAGGKRGKRGGDIGCENQPISQFFRFQPEHCKDNQISIDGTTFTLQSKIASIFGCFPQGSVLAVGNAEKWGSVSELTASAGEPAILPVMVASVGLVSEHSEYLVFQRVRDGEETIRAEELEALFHRTEQRRKEIAEQVLVETPDPFINAAVSALCVAADAIWDEPQGAVMHGAVAWRSPYAGWRGPYANDAFGRHDRSRRHLLYWANRQNTKPVSKEMKGPDPASNLARSHPAKQSCGDIGGKHYDMNLVYIDALVRHLLWTGDLELAEQLWPVIERHMAWERRLFRRTFGADNLPLYEAYAAIWASDDLQYHGGGVTHTSAYNYYHNRMIARLADMLGKDSSPYQHEADHLLEGMKKYLWLADRGWYGEWKDSLGFQAVHPSPALWTFYHVIDSQAADPFQAWQMSRYVDTQIAHIPIHGPQIPEGRCWTLPTTNWMPYTWSTNNVVMAEAAHTALAYWQAGRAKKAFAVFKGCLLDSMYMGICPGNAGMTTYFDMARGEAQRDFGDAVGTCSRAVIEGLFGIRPDMLRRELTIIPGFPAEWEFARLRHPDLCFEYLRSDRKETYSVRPMFTGPVTVRLVIPSRYTEIQRITVNGDAVSWSPAIHAVGIPRIEIKTRPADQINLVIYWKGTRPSQCRLPEVVGEQAAVRAEFGKADVLQVEDTQRVLDRIRLKKNGFEAKAAGLSGHRTVFARLRQGQMTWWKPVEFELRWAYEIIAAEQQPDNCVRFRVRNNTSDQISTRAVIQVNQKNKKIDLKIPAYGLSEEISLSAGDFSLLPGSSRVRVDLGKERAAEGIVGNWKIGSTGEISCEPINLDGVFNDQVAQIFKNEYRSPRSPYCSLAIPKQGIGSWCDFARTYEVDDSGLRGIAKENGDSFLLPHGVAFRTPGQAEAKNVVFVSQWDNYPAQIRLELAGRARHLYLLMAGSTNSMQSRFDNGMITVIYADETADQLALHNPTTWWPIDQDYFIDDYGFRRPEPIPPRVYLQSGKVRTVYPSEYKGLGGMVEGGAAMVLDLPLRPEKELKALKIQALANEVVIGLMSATLIR